MFQNSHPAAVSALAAILGSLTGALGSSVSTWVAQRHQAQRDLLSKRIFHHEQLYSDFIRESARVLADAIEHDFRDLDTLTPTHAALSRIRVSSSAEVLGAAERVVDHVFATYAGPNLTPEEIRSRASRQEDPLLEFSNVCRRELEGLWNSI